MGGITTLAEASTTLDMTSISTAIGNVFQVCGDVLNQITANPVFLMFFCVSLIYTGARVVSTLKHV